MKLKIRRILFPTDFTDTSKEARFYATSLAEKFDAELHVLHVVLPASTFFVSQSPFLPQENALQHRVASVEKRLAAEIDSQWSLNHPLRRAVVMGFPYDEIVKYADDQDIDLIVVGTHEYSGLYHFMTGSLAERLVRLSSVPVLTIHSNSQSVVVETDPNQAVMAGR